MKNAIPATESLTRDQKISMLADTMMAKAAELHKAAMALKSEIKNGAAGIEISDSVSRRNSRIKIVPQGR
jgi:hypothetical protein